MKSTSKLKDLKGKKFGKLEVIETVFCNKRGHRIWKCKCDCGNDTTVPTNSLVSGRTTSCGCVYKSSRKNCNNIHGKTGTLLYKRWISMRARCSSISVHSKYYHDRGISYNTRWEGYKNFESDMKTSFESHLRKYGSSNTTLERINTNKGYSKSNCRWTTKKEQNCNKREGFKITSYKRLKMFLKELSTYKKIDCEITREEFLTLSYNVRLKK